MWSWFTSTNNNKTVVVIALVLPSFPFAVLCCILLSFLRLATFNGSTRKSIASKPSRQTSLTPQTGTQAGGIAGDAFPCEGEHTRRPVQEVRQRPPLHHDDATRTAPAPGRPLQRDPAGDFEIGMRRAIQNARQRGRSSCFANKDGKALVLLKTIA